PLATYTMRRFWNVDITGYPIDETVDLKFYYDTLEQKAIIDAAQNFAALNGGVYEGFSWFKTATGSFNPSVNVQTANVLDALAVADSNTTALQESGISYALFTGISSFSGGTGAAGVGPNSDPLPVELL